MKKLRVGILFGGRSGEHEISLLSAASILQAIDRTRFDVVPIGITKTGHWVTSHDAELLLSGDDTKRSLGAQPRAGDPAATAPAAVLSHGQSVVLPPEPAAEISSGSIAGLDVVFPVLHGTFGEDGTIQGLFELADIAYVGSGVLGSSTGMDKDVMKRLFLAAGLPIPKHITLLRSDWRAHPRTCTQKIESALKYPVFVKPANLGSSVGISKVHDRSELAAAMGLAASFDRKLVIEQGVGGSKRKAREIEVAILGNDQPEASVPGEIIPGKEFYDYEAKYLSDGSITIIPAKLSREETAEVRKIAIAAFRACDCSGLARVDFLLDPAHGKKPSRLYLNEINTMPGFTKISQYPKLWNASGIPYKKLITRLIELALERHREKQQNQYSRD
jgi:D-alanine-D-alanine ligase